MIPQVPVMTRNTLACPDLPEASSLPLDITPSPPSTSTSLDITPSSHTATSPPALPEPERYCTYIHAYIYIYI